MCLLIQLSRFIEAHPNLIFHDLYLMAMELTKENINWLRQNYAAVKSWLVRRKPHRLSDSNSGQAIFTSYRFTQSNYIIYSIGIAYLIIYTEFMNWLVLGNNKMI